MRRILRAYENQIEGLLGWSNLTIEQCQRTISRFRELVKRCAQEQGIPEWMAAKEVWEQWRPKLERLLTVHAGPPEYIRTHPEVLKLPPSSPLPEPIRFRCDSGLGGLARWLRVAGYEAYWQPDWDDSMLVLACQRDGAILLTTDTEIMQRTVVRDQKIRALWIPPAFGLAYQLQLVFREFGLRRRPPRCTKCSGPLRIRPKEELQDRIPPRTYRWLDVFFECRQCGHLFWQGTHWQRIQQVLDIVEQGVGDSRKPNEESLPTVKRPTTRRGNLDPSVWWNWFCKNGVVWIFFHGVEGRPLQQAMDELREVFDSAFGEGEQCQTKDLHILLIFPWEVEEGFLQGEKRKFQRPLEVSFIGDPERELFQFFSVEPWMSSEQKEPAVVPLFSFLHGVGQKTIKPGYPIPYPIAGVLVSRRRQIPYQWRQHRKEEKPDWEKLVSQLKRLKEGSDEMKP